MAYTKKSLILRSLVLWLMMLPILAKGQNDCKTCWQCEKVYSNGKLVLSGTLWGSDERSAATHTGIYDQECLKERRLKDAAEEKKGTLEKNTFDKTKEKIKNGETVIQWYDNGKAYITQKGNVKNYWLSDGGFQGKEIDGKRQGKWKILLQEYSYQYSTQNNDWVEGIYKDGYMEGTWEHLVIALQGGYEEIATPLFYDSNKNNQFRYSKKYKSIFKDGFYIALLDTSGNNYGKSMDWSNMIEWDFKKFNKIISTGDTNDLNLCKNKMKRFLAVYPEDSTAKEMMTQIDKRKDAFINPDKAIASDIEGFKTLLWNIYMKVYGGNYQELLSNVPKEFQNNIHIKTAMKTVPDYMSKINNGRLSISDYKAMIKKIIDKINVSTINTNIYE